MILEELAADGYALLPGVASGTALVRLQGIVSGALEAETGVKRRRGEPFAARNLLEYGPAILEALASTMLPGFLARILGPEGGLVRALYLDKPPGRSWTLARHRDLTIAVRDNSTPCARFRCPTTKSGVPHVEAPAELLEAMVAARIHFDDVTEENGPLVVVPGSHRAGKEEPMVGGLERELLALEGDVVLMRPLLIHRSGRSKPGCSAHRRVLHLEFAASRALPDGFEWHDFVPV